MTTNTPSLTPFHLSAYQRDHMPDAARRGMRGYVLTVLISMAGLKGNNRGMCYPSIAYLAKKVGRSVRHVRRLLAELERMGEIQRIAQRRADGGHGSNIYQLRGLLSWAAKNVRGVSDKAVRKTPYGKNHNPARGGSSVSRKTTAAPSRPATGSAPVARPVSAGKGPSGFLRDPAPSPAPRRGLSPEQVEEARAKCDPVRWARLLVEAGMDGATGDDLQEGAARRWRAAAILRGDDLVA